MSYQNFFSELEMFGIKLGLAQTRELFDRIGSPDKKICFIHIAGTNGKGSVAAMLSAALTQAGFKTGLYTSPHLVSIKERFRIDGKAISESELEKLVKEIQPSVNAMKAIGSSPTYFEVTTALAAAYFAENKVDFAVWETGLGGRFDATNIVTPIVSIITGISRDHTEHLGDDLTNITFEKAGIIKDNIPVFCGEVPEEAVEVIKKKVQETNSALHFTKLAGNGSLANDFKLRNRTLASGVLQFLSEKFSFSLTEASKGLDIVQWPGRFQVFKDGTVIDGAHNPQAAKSLVSILKDKFPDKKFSILFANFADKDTENILKILAPIAEEFIFAEVGTTRKTCSPKKLEDMLRDFSEIPVTKVKTPFKALELTRRTPLLVTGSLYLVGEIIKEFIPEKEILDIY